ncbi:MAG: UDP-3-O-acylglucosamine N-acyltransferase [Ignavibacteria bacterium]|nr:UDP-3-O-acylglucosamine N-acyltransferase [Ignavibacteria bacterium]
MKYQISLAPKDIADITGGNIIGSTTKIFDNINRIEYAGENDLTLCMNQDYEKYLEDCPAACVIIDERITKLPRENQVFIAMSNPYEKFVSLLILIQSQQPIKPSFFHASAEISPTAKIGENSSIAEWCVVGDNCEIADDVVLYPGVILYDNVKIGRGTKLHANVVCCEDTIIGENCIIHPGAVVGSDGFGNIENKDGSYSKIPQLGNVVIGNNVEIGANTTIDCSMVGSTIIEDGVKIDNLVQVAHSVVICENSAMAAQVGIAGSVRIGKRNRIGGQVGFAGHLDTADDVTIMAQSGVAKSVPSKGVYFGSPLKERLQAFKIEAVMRQLPQFFADFQDLKKKVIEKLGIEK